MAINFSTKYWNSDLATMLASYENADIHINVDDFNAAIKDYFGDNAPEYETDVYNGLHEYFDLLMRWNAVLATSGNVSLEITYHRDQDEDDTFVTARYTVYFSGKNKEELENSVANAYAIVAFFGAIDAVVQKAGFGLHMFSAYLDAYEKLITKARDMREHITNQKLTIALILEIQGALEGHIEDDLDIGHHVVYF